MSSVPGYPASGAAGSSGLRPAAAAPRGATGAKVLTFVGAVILVGALVAGFFAAMSFMRVLPTDIVSSDGGPGSGVLATGELPGVVEVDLPESSTYTIWQVGPVPDRSISLDQVNVTDAAGSPVMVWPATVSGSAAGGDSYARTVAEFTAGPGLVTVEVTTTQVAEGSTFVVVPGQRFDQFFGGLLSTIMLWFIAVGGFIVGLGMVIGGVVWWVVSRSRSQAAPAVGAPPPSH